MTSAYACCVADAGALAGKLLASVGDEQEAENKLTAAVAAAPEDDRCIGELAEFYSQLKDDQAAELFERAIAGAVCRVLRVSE